jgi:hypothetical protein
MFQRIIRLSIAGNGELRPVPARWLDDFFMADFDGYRVFDDTLTAADGLLEAGLLVPLDEVQSRFEAWLRKRHKLEADEALVVGEIDGIS